MGGAGGALFRLHFSQHEHNRNAEETEQGHVAQIVHVRINRGLLVEAAIQLRISSESRDVRRGVRKHYQIQFVENRLNVAAWRQIAD